MTSRVVAVRGRRIAPVGCIVVALALVAACQASIGEEEDSAGSNGPSQVGSGGALSTGGTPATTGPCDIVRVREIFRTRCADGVCHDSGKPAADLDLTIADPGAVLMDRAASLCMGETLVIAGDPQSSLLWQKVAGTTDCGEKMPIAGALAPEDVQCLADWIVDLAAGPVDCERCGGETCVDLSTDPAHCGSCGSACLEGAICAGGQCKSCGAGETDCGTKCADLTLDEGNCGACGVVCGAGEQCVEGACACSAASVSFASDVAPLLGQSCTDTGCHAGARPKEGLSLEVSDSYQALVNGSSEQCSDGRKLVVPGKPAESYLLSKLTGVDMCSGTLMPKAGSSLAADDLATISAWICGGAQDN